MDIKIHKDTAYYTEEQKTTLLNIHDLFSYKFKKGNLSWMFDMSKSHYEIHAEPFIKDGKLSVSIYQSTGSHGKSAQFIIHKNGSTISFNEIIKKLSTS